MDGDSPLPRDDREAAATGIELCRAGHRRLIATVHGLDDEVVLRPSLLPGWSVGHVLTHLARNADGHARRLEGALRGEEVPRYPGGSAERESDIEAGAARPAHELAADVTVSAERLEEVWAQSAEAGWPSRELLAGDTWRTPESPWRRLREVEVHHVDLGLDYRAEDWPEEYLAVGISPGARDRARPCRRPGRCAPVPCLADRPPERAGLDRARTLVVTATPRRTDQDDGTFRPRMGLSSTDSPGVPFRLVRPLHVREVRS